MFEGEYNEQIDIWALGVIAYLLCYQTLPFEAKYEKELQ
jgi:serine/threonine protein kinase